MRVPHVNIVVPVRNEERDLAPSVRRLVAYLRESFPFRAQITFADNGSTHATWVIAGQLARELPEVRAVHMKLPGRGRALRAIWSQSEAEVLAYMDVDLSTDWRRAWLVGHRGLGGGAFHEADRGRPDRLRPHQAAVLSERSPGPDAMDPGFHCAVDPGFHGVRAARSRVVATIVESILARSYAFVVVSLRYLIVGGWAAGVVLAVMFLPPLSATSSGGLSDLIPPGSAAARAEADAAHLFGFPIDAAVAIVQRDPHGMPAVTRDRAIRQAIAVDRRLSGQSEGQLAAAAAALAKAGQPDAARILSGPVSPGPPGGIPGLAGAFPLPNTAGLLRGTNEQSTTVITFLYFRPGTSFGAQTAGANAYAHWFLNRPDDHVVGVTGPVPAEYDQSQIIGKYILWVELFTVLAIALIVGLRFRSVGAPLATLACAATAYVIAIRVVVWLAGRMGVTLPPDLDPVLVVLLLGVTTDYTVFFLDGMRAQVAGGVPRIRAARLATAEFAPIILAAGIIVAAAAASLVVARTKMLSAFGPGLALTVLTAMAVSMTLGPALMAIFGGLLFRPVPRWMRRRGVSRREGGGRADATPQAGASLRTRVARFAAARPVALLIAAAGTAGLVVAA